MGQKKQTSNKETMTLNYKRNKNLHERKKLEGKEVEKNNETKLGHKIKANKNKLIKLSCYKCLFLSALKETEVSAAASIPYV